MNQDFTVQKKQYLSEKKNSCRGVHLKKKNPAQAEGEKKNSCKLKMVRPLARYPQPDQRDIPV